jgi:WhiB family transcriptional regulator, redox-sensing transcriptional regulator
MTAPWQLQAACADTTVDLWFPDPSDTVTEAAAKTVCGPCPVRWACLAHALTQPEHYGIWGGLNETELRGLRRQLRRTRRGTAA